MKMARKRPLGVTILGIYLLFYSLIGFIIALSLLGYGGNLLSNGNPFGAIFGVGVMCVGLIYLAIVISRFFVAIGVLKLKRKAWKGAFIILSIGMLIDMIQGFMFAVFLGMVALIYLIFVRRHFRS